MNVADAERFLAQTLADLKLSGGEKQALTAWLADQVKTDAQRGAVRHTAFDLARKAVADPTAVQVIGWLEDVLRTISPVQPPAGGPAGPGEVAAFFAPGDACWKHIVHRIESTRRTLDLCVYTITDDRISYPILHAHHRGVKVRVITDAEKLDDAGSDIGKFRAAGIAVKLDDIDRSKTSGHMHHKFGLFDAGRLITGSYNWTRGAADTNYENIVDTTDPRLVSLFATEFDRLWNRF